MKSQPTVFARWQGPLSGLGLSALFIAGLGFFGKNYAPLFTVLKRIQDYGGPSFFVIAGIVLLALSIIFSMVDQKSKQAKMEAKTESEKWVLALSAIYVELSEVLEKDDIESFYRIDMTRSWYMGFVHNFTRLVLKNSWEIIDRRSALQTLNTLFLKVEDDSEKPYTAWDGVRFVHVARLACLSDYISPEEAWEQLKRIGPLMQKAFSSWRELNENFLEGRALWRGGVNDLDKLKAAYNQLLRHDQSPWQTLKWGMKLGN